MSDNPITQPGVGFHCIDTCPQHDGKRCRILGYRAPDFCGPSMNRIEAQLVDAREESSDLYDRSERYRMALGELYACLSRRRADVEWCEGVLVRNEIDREELVNE